MIKNKLMPYLLVLTFVVIAVAGCLTTAVLADSESSRTVSVDGAMYDGTVILGQSSWIGYAPLYLAEKKGFFSKYGADVKVQYFESKTASKSALAVGRIQAMSTTVDTHVMSAAAGLDISIVLVLDTSCGGDGIIAKKNIPDIASLAGHTVALDTSGGASYFWFQYLLQEEGLTLGDVVAVNMSSGDAGAAFIAGEVDAAVTWEPWLSKARATKDGTVLIDSSESPGVIVDAMAMKRDFIKKYPGTVRAISNGWYDALAFIKSNPADAYEIMAKYTGNESGEDLRKAMESEVELYDAAGNIEYFKSDIKDITQRAADLWLEMNLIEKEPDTAALVNGNYLERISE